LMDGDLVGPEPECVVLDAGGRQRWFGEPSRAAIMLVEALAHLVEAHRDRATGIAWCSHYEGAQVYLPRRDMGLRPAFEELAAADPSFKLEILPVAFPLAPLLTLVQRVGPSCPELSGIVTGLGPDIRTGGLTVTVEPRSAMPHEEIIDRINKVASDLIGAEVPITIRPGGIVLA
jgi:streptogrisin C